MRIRARAIRRCGELLTQIEKAQGGDRKSDKIKGGGASPFDSPRKSQDKEMEKTAMRIRARAIRRCGQLLKEIEAKHTGRIRTDSDPNSDTRKQAAGDAGLSQRQAKDAIRVANIEGQSFEAQIEGEDPPTVTALAEQGKAKAKWETSKTPCHRSLQNQPVGVESKPATLRRGFHNRCKG